MPLATSTDPLPKKLKAAQEFQLCVLQLGPDLGSREPLSSFSHTELEVSAARDHPQTRVLIFAEQAAEKSLSSEQQEFVERMSDFKQAEFKASPVSIPEELVRQVEQALKGWQPLQPQQTFLAPRRRDRLYMLH